MSQHTWTIYWGETTARNLVERADRSQQDMRRTCRRGVGQGRPRRSTSRQQTLPPDRMTGGGVAARGQSPRSRTRSPTRTHRLGSRTGGPGPQETGSGRGPGDQGRRRRALVAGQGRKRRARLPWLVRLTGRPWLTGPARRSGFSRRAVRSARPPLHVTRTSDRQSHGP